MPCFPSPRLAQCSTLDHVICVARTNSCIIHLHKACLLPFALYNEVDVWKRAKSQCLSEYLVFEKSPRLLRECKTSDCVFATPLNWQASYIWHSTLALVHDNVLPRPLCPPFAPPTPHPASMHHISSRFGRFFGVFPMFPTLPISSLRNCWVVMVETKCSALLNVVSKRATTIRKHSILRGVDEQLEARPLGRTTHLPWRG